MFLIFFFFKQKTAYEMRISDWSSDVCSSDLAGGVRLKALDDALMLVPGAHAVPAGTFFAGEMLDWEAPTGGYLLTACFASGRRAGEGAVAWLARKSVV